MSGPTYAAMIQYRKMVEARSEEGEKRAKHGKKHPDFQDNE